MAQITYRANLSSKVFPFIQDDWGRSIIVPQYDNTFNRQVVSTEDPDKDVGIPQAYYMHNVMPDSHGFRSIGYLRVILPFGAGVEDFYQIHIIRDSTNDVAYLGLTSTNDFYINSGAGWVFKGNYPLTGILTIAYANGVNYIWVQGYGCIVYNFGAEEFTWVTLTGLSIPDVIGILGAQGYIIAWSIDTVSWSSTIDPTDFVPSLITGAGGGSVQGTKGGIVVCIPHSLGFIVYTSSNAVAAVYSSNSRFPFNFREIVQSGGVSSPSLIAFDADTTSQYAYTTSGFQLVSMQQSSTVFPELTNFIAGGRFEDFNETTNLFSLITLLTTMRKNIAVVASRYFIISYGVSELTHAIIYDITLKRFGKIKITHVDVIEYQLPLAAIVEIPRQSIGLLQKDGTVVVIDFSERSDNSSGVIWLGKYQFVRPRLLQVDTVTVENVLSDNFSLLIYSALDGKNAILQEDAALLSDNGKSQVYGARAVGINHSLLLKGKFYLESLILQFNIHGKR